MSTAEENSILDDDVSWDLMGTGLLPECPWKHALGASDSRGGSAGVRREFRRTEEQKGSVCV